MKFPLVKLFLIALPLIEIAGFIIVGRVLGVTLTLLLVIFTSFLGLLILRKGGIFLIWRMYRNQGKILDIFQGSFSIISGLLLLLPGFFTDIVGLLLLLPPVQHCLLRHLLRWRGTQGTSQQRIIEGEYWQHDEQK